MTRLLFLLVVLALTGCRKPAIHSYVAPRESALDAAVPEPAAEPLPQLAWKLPPGWTQTPAGQMNAASFAIDDASGGATVAITPLPNLAGREDALVNMWREQVQLGPLSPEEMAKVLQPAEVAGGQGHVFEINGSRDGKPARTVAAMLHRGSRSWFFKLAGDDAAVMARKAEFIEFVKTVRFEQGAASGEQGAGSGYKWTVPPAWTVQSIGAMQVAKFSVPAVEAAKGDVTVSVFPSESGGVLANVNRWRGQIGLAEIDEAALGTVTRPLDATPGAMFVELRNEPRVMLGAIVPRDGQWFFYKLLGDALAVDAAKEDFIRFAKSTP
ncbi:MAG: hypothetical protein ABMA13_16760 [Chthoniobacteraceae bacterium]